MIGLEGLWGSGRMDPRIHNLSTGWRWVIFSAPATLPPGKETPVPIGCESG